MGAECSHSPSLSGALEEAVVPAREDRQDRQPRFLHIALLIGGLGTVLIWYWTAVFTGSMLVPEPPARLPRFQQLCNRAEAGGEEGILSDKARVGLVNLTLQGLVITHRHGDRSAIHDVPGNMEVTHFSCAADDLEELWTNFPTQYQVISAALEEKPLQREFRPKLLQGAPDAACARLRCFNLICESGRPAIERNGFSESRKWANGPTILR